MSYALHAYFLNDDPRDEAWAFNSIKDLFSNTERVKFDISQNPFTKQNILKLKVDGSYSISAFFEAGDAVTQDLEFIAGKKIACNSRIRFLFAPDPANDFDDIGVIVLDYLERFRDVIIYSANQEKIIFSPAQVNAL